MKGYTSFSCRISRDVAYSRVRLVSRENEYSCISRMKFELRFLHTDEKGGAGQSAKIIIEGIT